MTTKKPEDEKPPAPTKHDDDKKRSIERLPTDDPMATPPYDVHAPNPPSEGEK
jgi:hypothetical protein